jgi:hypothetical protein
MKRGLTAAPSPPVDAGPIHPGRRAVVPGDPGPSSTAVNRSIVLWLGALVLLLVFVALEPLSTFPIFGSDTGEYYSLTSDLVTTGHLPLASYAGWGYGYQDFPGIFVVAGGVAGAVGTGPLNALQVAIPVLAVLSVVPLFLLFRRLFPNDAIALLGAGLATVAMPRMFSLAHPAPLALGDLFVVGALWMLVEGRRDVRWYVPLALTGGALVVTHHLSTYFFLVTALGGLVILELAAPGRWSRRLPARELAFLGGLGAVALAYWLAYAQAFKDHVLGAPFDTLSPAGVAAIVAAPIVLVVLLGGLFRWRRARAAARSRGAPGPRLPTDRAIVRDVAIIGGGVIVGVSLLLVVPLPGTSQVASAGTILWFVPLILLIAGAAGARRLVYFQRLGPFTLAWVAAVGLSALIALGTGDAVVSPLRHAEYLLIPIGLLAAVALGRLVARLGDAGGRRAAAAGATALVLLLAANAAIAYPPPSDFGGFQEGLTGADAAVWEWVGMGLPPNAVVASDHRISSMVFGFDGNPATWDSTPALFNGGPGDWPQVAAELNASYAPHGTPRPVDAVIVDATMYQGVALDPNAIAAPLSGSAQGWLSGAPFIPVYESGPQVVYWVDGPIS